MPAKKTFQSARFRGPVVFDQGATIQGVPISQYREFVATLSYTTGVPLTRTIQHSDFGDLTFVQASTGLWYALVGAGLNISKFSAFAISRFTDGDGNTCFPQLLPQNTGLENDLSVALFFYGSDGALFDPADFDLFVNFRVYF